MDLEDLRAVQADERRTDSVQALPDTFYRDVEAYVRELREQRDSAADAVDDPFDDSDVRRLSDEVATVEDVVEAIYDRRVGKIVKRASLAASGMPADEAGLTEEERDLFDRLVDEIEANRQRVLGTLGDEGTVAPVVPDAGSDDPARAGGDASDAAPDTAETAADRSDPEERTGTDDGDTRIGPDDAPSTEPDGGSTDADVTEEDRQERVTLRITTEVGEVFGVDERVYELDEEDVVTLPAANADPLLERDAAERLE